MGGSVTLDRPASVEMVGSVTVGREGVGGSIRRIVWHHSKDCSSCVEVEILQVTPTLQCHVYESTQTFSFCFFLGKFLRHCFFSRLVVCCIEMI